MIEQRQIEILAKIDRGERWVEKRGNTKSISVMDFVVGTKGLN